MEIKAQLLEVFETNQVSERFRKREFVVEYAPNPEYPEFLKFELAQDRCELLDGFQAGQEVTVEFDLKGRKWTDPQGQVKYFNSLRAWRITATDSRKVEHSTQHTRDEDAPPPENLGAPTDNDLPF